MTTLLTILGVVILAIIIALIAYVIVSLVRRNNELDRQLKDETMRATHWNKQFNELLEGPEGAFARRLIEENEALSKGLDEAIDDHMQEQASWDEEKTQYDATIEDLKDQLHNVYEAHRLLKLDFDSVREAALAMQIELGEHDHITPDTKITLDPDAAVKDPSGTIIGTVHGRVVRNTPEGIIVDMTFND